MEENLQNSKHDSQAMLAILVEAFPDLLLGRMYKDQVPHNAVTRSRYVAEFTPTTLTIRRGILDASAFRSHGRSTKLLTTFVTVGFHLCV